MPTTDSSRFRSRWAMPAFCLALGLAFLVAGLLGDDAGSGVGGLVVMSVMGVAFLALTPHSETIAGLGGPGRDERWASIDVHATAISGLVLIVVILSAFFYEIATGRNGEPWSQLGAVGGVAYVVAVLVLRRRG
jgi:hypothetical protein